ncbi:flagellar filament capping protein FliD [Neobacillus sp. YIM B06451]|uniref:flagellar filament capping protein FliD n=1 Tax=Neobacillus sp. YIM B06451 TaxID=3070994 RepID=UPI00292D4686|nr:flagellar filament capping protein FliD [Neobacillus sp. YIM B06451]
MNTSSVTRITGLASGLDTESIVKKLMDVERIPLNQLKQKQQKQTWLLDSYRQLNSDFLAFRNSTLFNMKLSSSYNTFAVTSSLSNAISGTGTGSAIQGTYSIEVKDLARQASFTGENVSLDPTLTLGEQGILQPPNTSTSISISVTDPANPSVEQKATIEILATDKIGDVVSKINGAVDGTTNKSLGLQAFYDPNLQQFTMRTKATGKDAKIVLSENSASVDFLGQTLKLDTTNLVANGTNAHIIFDGKEITNFSTNNGTIMGINFSFKSTTVGTSTVTVTRSVEAEVKNIKDFVEKYNSLIDRLNKLVSEPVYRDYQPLLDDQKTDMSEKQIEKWEEKAKSGLLRNDSILTAVLNKMRGIMNSTVSTGSSYNSLSSIGIGSKSYQDRGKLYIDETKLTAAIQADPDAVQKLFSQVGDTATGANGLVNQLSDEMQTAISQLTKKAGVTGSSQMDQSTVGRLLARIQNDINRQTDRLFRKEDQYYRQFTEMEKAVAKFNSQSSWLYQQSGM